MKSSRKKRTWAITRTAMTQLGPGAQRLARKSASQSLTPGVARRIQQLRFLMAVERESKLRQGDLLVELIDEHGLRPIDIARDTGQRPNDLSQRYHTARMFPPALRQPDVPFNTYLMAMRMTRKFRGMKLSPTGVLDEIISHGFSQHRDVTRYFSQRARAEESRQAALLTSITSRSSSTGQAYHARFQTLRNLFAEGSIKLLNLDPPYVYARGTKYASRSARSLECDSSSPDEAVALVLDALGQWQPALAPGGALLLWQPSQLLLKPIADAIDAHGWAVEALCVWDKGRPQPGAFDSPYTAQAEHLLVLKRRGDTLINHDNSPRGNILRFDPVSRPGLADGQEHAFEKPADLCRFLIGKHTFPGELVVDLCGCTGSMAVAAADLGRRWAYIESRLANYRIGAARLEQVSVPSRAEAS